MAHRKQRPPWPGSPPTPHPRGRMVQSWGKSRTAWEVADWARSRTVGYTGLWRMSLNAGAGAFSDAVGINGWHPFRVNTGFAYSRRPFRITTSHLVDPRWPEACGC